MAVAGLLAGCSATTSGAGPGQSAHFRELTVERMIVSGPDGVRRFIISYDAPKAPFAGMELERNVPAGFATMLLLDEAGNEVGGVGSSASGALIMLDYRQHALEAIGLGTSVAPGGLQSAGLVVKQPPVGAPADMLAVARGARKLEAAAASGSAAGPSDPDVREYLRFRAQQVNRIEVGAASTGVATVAVIELKDSQGRPRIRLLVDESDNPVIVTLDAEGNETGRLPEATGR